MGIALSTYVSTSYTFIKRKDDIFPHFTRKVCCLIYSLDEVIVSHEMSPDNTLYQIEYVVYEELS